MFSKIQIASSTKNWSEQLERLKEALADADAVVIGAGAGLSTSAGYTYGGERFRKYFSDFEEKYGFHDMYTGGFWQYPTAEEYWGFWSRMIHCNRYTPIPGTVYHDLLRLVEKKDYFVLTTNVDHCFQRAGFDKKRLFYTQGDYGLFQCPSPCSPETYDNEALIRYMVKEQKNMRIPSELIPRCPKCGRPMIPNLRCDDRFAEDKGWHLASGRYADFLRTRGNQKLLFLELGVGYNTPAIIKYPFWRMTAANRRAVYACINNGEAVAPDAIGQQSILINGDIGSILADLR